MKKIFLAVCYIFISASYASADSIAINHFVIKENPFAKDQIAVVATDSLDNIRESVNGIFLFMINGFEDTLKFEKGVGFYRHKINKSTFLYVRHVNEKGTHARLYYVYKSDDTLRPIHISWSWLLIIPCALFLLGYLFKKFIVFALIILVIFIYFNYHNGLNVPTFFESIIDGLKAMF
jgi:hypothetical protein